MTYSDVDRRDTLHYRLLSRSTEPPGSWGHEYVRHLATQVAHEFYMIEYEPAQKLDQDRADPKYDSTATDPIQKREYTRSMLVDLAMELVDFFLKHNAEADAVDVVIEVENIQALLPLVDEKTYERVCRYMVRSVHVGVDLFLRGSVYSPLSAARPCLRTRKTGTCCRRLRRSTPSTTGIPRHWRSPSA